MHACNYCKNQPSLNSVACTPRSLDNLIQEVKNILLLEDQGQSHLPRYAVHMGSQCVCVFMDGWVYIDRSLEDVSA